MTTEYPTGLLDPNCQPGPELPARGRTGGEKERAAVEEDNTERDTLTLQKVALEEDFAESDTIEKVDLEEDFAEKDATAES